MNVPVVVDIVIGMGPDAVSSNPTASHVVETVQLTVFRRPPEAPEASGVAAALDGMLFTTSMTMGTSPPLDS